MTKKIVYSCIVMLLFSATLFAQNVGQHGDTQLNYKDINGKKQGAWEKKHYNGKLKYKGFFLNDKPIGDFWRYDTHGIMTVHMVFDSIGLTAKATFYHDGKRVAVTGAYYDKKKDGIWKYYDADGTIYLQESFNKGVKDGRFLQYNKDSVIIEEKNFTNGIENGVWIKRYMNGNLLWESNYVNGKLEGKVKAYYKTGKIHKEGGFKNDLMHGDWLIYDEHGNYEKTYHYKNGRSPEADAEEQKRMKELEENVGKYPGPRNENDIDWLRDVGR